VGGGVATSRTATTNAGPIPESHFMVDLQWQIMRACPIFVNACFATSLTDGTLKLRSQGYCRINRGQGPELQDAGACSFAGG
jgi:hypothetical protein